MFSAHPAQLTSAPNPGHRAGWLRWLLVAACAVPCLACGSSKPPAVQAPVIYPEEPAVGRIQFLTSISTDQDVVGKSTGLRTFVTGERAAIPIKKAFGATAHGDELFVCDGGFGHGFVWVIDLKKKKIARLGAEKPGRMRQPLGVAIAKDGTRYVADSGHRRVMVYDSSNRYVTAYGEPGSWRPVGIAVRGRELYVSDIANSQIAVLDRKTGEELRRVGTKGGKPGELYLPTGIAVDKDGFLYVADTGNFRLQKLSADGEPLKIFGRLGKRPGEFARPKGISVDREGRVYAVDAAFANIQIFAPDGKLLLPFSSVGNGPGQLNLPFDVAINYDAAPLFKKYVAPGRDIAFVILATSEFGPNKLNVYGFLKLTPEDQERAERSLRAYEKKLAAEKQKELEEAEKKDPDDDDELIYKGPGSDPDKDKKDGGDGPDAANDDDPDDDPQTPKVAPIVE